MEILLMASRTGRVRQFRLRHWQVWIGVPTLILGLVAGLFAALWLLVDNLPIARDTVLNHLLDASTVVQRQVSQRSDGSEALTERVGELQAELVRLKREQAALAAQQGLDLQEHNLPPAQGGPEVPLMPRGASVSSALDALSLDVENYRADSALLADWTHTRSAGTYQVPVRMPLDLGEYTSNFGARSDPFTGRQAMHEGIDFAAPIGTPIYAAADGEVAYAGFHNAYGNLIEISHGNGISTRYAHTSKLLVKVGQTVKAGDEIALVGSTGRSTGAHLHFEVRYQGIAQNPSRFLPATAG